MSNAMRIYKSLFPPIGGLELSGPRFDADVEEVILETNTTSLLEKLAPIIDEIVLAQLGECSEKIKSTPLPGYSLPSRMPENYRLLNNSDARSELLRLYRELFELGFILHCMGMQRNIRNTPGAPSPRHLEVISILSLNEKAIEDTYDIWLKEISNIYGDPKSMNLPLYDGIDKLILKTYADSNFIPLYRRNSIKGGFLGKNFRNLNKQNEWLFYSGTLLPTMYSLASGYRSAS